MSSTANFINEIDQTAPDGAVQRVSIVDDYLRMLARVLVNTFPEFVGVAVDATEADINQLVGAFAAGGLQFRDERGAADGYASLDSSGQVPASQLPFGEAGFPAGTRLLFQQATAPVGWVKETNVAYNDKALRFTTGSAMSGGSAGFDATFPAGADRTIAASAATVLAGSGVSSTRVASQTHTHVLSMRLAYVGVIIAQKAP